MSRCHAEYLISNIFAGKLRISFFASEFDFSVFSSVLCVFNAHKNARFDNFYSEHLFVMVANIKKKL